MKQLLLLLAIVPAIAFSQRDTCIKQQWKIEVGKNTYAVKDTTFCFKYTPGTGGTVIKDTIFITNNVLYKGEKGDKGDPGMGLPGPAGPQGPQGAPGVCPNCPVTGVGGVVVNRQPNAVYVDDYGAIPGDNKDDLAAFNAARDASIAAGHRTVIFGNGEYTLKGLWNATQGVGNFSKIIIRGQGRTDQGAMNEKMTLIRCENTSGPCITVNAFRLGEMSDFVLEGNQYEFTKIMAETKSGDTICWRPENWVKPGNSLDKYEHQSGIAIDYGQTVAPWAAQGIFERLKITGFVVGISISPSPNSYQGDTYWFRDIKMEGNVYGISVGQDQARSITFENVWMNLGYCAYVNNRFGRGNGSAFNVTGGQYTSLFKLFECTNAYVGQMDISGIYTEACGILGAINGLGSNTNAFVFSGCNLSFDDNAYGGAGWGHWVTPFCIFSSGGNAVFTGCNIRSQKKIIGFGGHYIMNGNTFTDTRPVFPFWPAVNITGRPMFDWGTQLTDIVDVSGGIRKSVRFGVSQIKRYGYSEPPVVRTTGAEVFVPYWGPGVWQPLPDTKAKQFEWAIPANETRWYKVGDYLDCQASDGLIPGMNTDFGQTMLPGLEVVEVKAASLVLRKIAPEMRVESWYRSGQVYSEPYLWVTRDPVVAKASGTVVECTGGNLLRPGDYVWDGESTARVVEVVGSVVTFNRTVKAGELKCVK